MILSLCVYLFLFLLMEVCSIEYEKRRKDTRLLFIILAIFIYSIVIGLRNNVGIDYLNYKNLFFNDGFDINRSVEIQWLVRFLNFLNLPFYSLFIVSAFLQIFFFIKFYKDYKKCLSWGIFFYFTTLYFFLSMNVIRQCIAWAIFLYATRYIYKKNLLKYILLIVFATLFHKSAIILIIFYFIPKRIYLNKNIIIIFYYLSLLTGVGLSHYINNTVTFIAPLIGYENYGENIEKLMETISFASENSLGVAKILWITINTLVIIQSKKLIEYYGKSANIIYFLYIIGIIIDALVGGTILDRAAMYFLPFRIIVYSFLFTYIYKRENQFYKYLASFLGVIFITFYIYSGIIGNASGCTPFNFI